MTRRKDRFSWGCSPMSCPGGHWDYGVRGRGRGTEPALEGGVCSRAGCGHLVPTVRGRVQGRHPLGGVSPACSRLWVGGLRDGTGASGLSLRSMCPLGWRLAWGQIV